MSALSCIALGARIAATHGEQLFSRFADETILSPLVNDVLGLMNGIASQSLMENVEKGKRDARSSFETMLQRHRAELSQSGSRISPHVQVGLRDVVFSNGVIQTIFAVIFDTSTFRAAFRSPLSNLNPRSQEAVFFLVMKALHTNPLTEALAALWIWNGVAPFLVELLKAWRSSFRNTTMDVSEQLRHQLRALPGNARRGALPEHIENTSVDDADTSSRHSTLSLSFNFSFSCPSESTSSLPSADTSAASVASSSFADELKAGQVQPDEREYHECSQAHAIDVEALFTELEAWCQVISTGAGIPNPRRFGMVGFAPPTLFKTHAPLSSVTHLCQPLGVTNEDAFEDRTMLFPQDESNFLSALDTNTSFNSTHGIYNRTIDHHFNTACYARFDRLNDVESLASSLASFSLTEESFAHEVNDSISAALELRRLKQQDESFGCRQVRRLPARPLPATASHTTLPFSRGVQSEAICPDGAQIRRTARVALRRHREAEDELARPAKRSRVSMRASISDGEYSPETPRRSSRLRETKLKAGRVPREEKDGGGASVRRRYATLLGSRRA